MWHSFQFWPSDLAAFYHQIPLVDSKGPWSFLDCGQNLQLQETCHCLSALSVKYSASHRIQCIWELTKASVDSVGLAAHEMNEPNHKLKHIAVPLCQLNDGSTIGNSEYCFLDCFLECLMPTSHYFLCLCQLILSLLEFGMRNITIRTAERRERRDETWVPVTEWAPSERVNELY